MAVSSPDAIEPNSACGSKAGTLRQGYLRRRKRRVWSKIGKIAANERQHRDLYRPRQNKAFSILE
jgi:hypothetical protein